MMERIILVGHGSPKKDANRMELVGRLLHSRMHPGCGDGCVRISYLQYDSPTLADAIGEAVNEGAKSIIVHPYFLNSGVHVTEDIPRLISEAEKEHSGVEFLYTAPLGISEDIVKVVFDRIAQAKGIAPGEIEGESFKSISGEVDLSDLSEEVQPIVTRVIHTTADFGYRNTMVFHPDAVRAGIAALRAGKSIVTDVEMLRAGINKSILNSLGGEVVCKINEVSTAGDKTRTEAAIEKALAGDNVGIVAVGNAPTALFRCIEMINAGRAGPDLVVGVPVGFVRAEESKALLCEQEFPYISNIGRKGGSPVAAAIVNALLKMTSV